MIKTDFQQIEMVCFNYLIKTEFQLLKRNKQNTLISKVKTD